MRSQLAKLGQLKKPGLRKEWNLYFDYITRAFSNKYTNFDSLPIISRQIRYSLSLITIMTLVEYCYALIVIDYLLIEGQYIMVDLVSLYLIIVSLMLLLLKLRK